MNENLIIIFILIVILIFAGLLMCKNQDSSVVKPSPFPPLPPSNFATAQEPYFYKNEYSNNFKADWNLTKEERELQCKYTLGGLNQKYTIKTPPNEQPIDFKKLFPLNYDG